MKLLDLFEKQKHTSVIKPKKRPKGTLWFTDKQSWYIDIRNYLNPKANLVMDGDKNIYANNDSNTITFGVWYSSKNKGITFEQPRATHILTNNKKFIKIV